MEHAVLAYIRNTVTEYEYDQMMNIFHKIITSCPRKSECELLDEKKKMYNIFVCHPNVVKILDDYFTWYTFNHLI